MPLWVTVTSLIMREMPGHPFIQPFHWRDLSLPSGEQSCTHAAPALLEQGFIIQMEQYNGLYSDSIQIDACPQLGSLPINFKTPHKRKPNCFMMYPRRDWNSSEYGHLGGKIYFSGKTFGIKKKKKLSIISQKVFNFSTELSLFREKPALYITFSVKILCFGDCRRVISVFTHYTLMPSHTTFCITNWQDISY